MRSPTMVLRVALVAIFAFAMFTAVGPAAAQPPTNCTTASTVMSPGMVASKMVHFTFPGATTTPIICTTTASMSANCSYGATFLSAGMNSAMLNVFGTGSAPGASCMFACGQCSMCPGTRTVNAVACTITLDSGDGLPVELMDFSVAEDGTEDEGGGEKAV